MPIDASIYGNIKQPEGPLDQYGKVLHLKSLMGQSKLQELQTTKTERDMAEEQALHDVFTNAPKGATLESLVPDAVRASPKGGIDLQGKVLKQKELQGNIDKTQLELTSKSAELHREQLANVNDPQSAAQWVQAGYSDPHIAPILSRGGTVEQAIARIPQDPAQFQEWKARNGMGIQKFLEQQNTNAQHALNRAVTREGHDVTTRGQDMTDSRQRELNGIMEGQIAEPSPALIKSIASGEVELKPPPSNARNPIMLQRYGQMLEKVKAENPNWSAEMHPTIKKTVAGFAAGNESKTIQALSNATGHLDTYEHLALAMKNGDTQAINGIINKAKEQFGSATPTTPQAVAQVLAAEVVKAIAGSAGGVTDREHAGAIFSNKKSPEQMLEANAAMRELMGQQFRTLDQKYKAGTYGRQDFANRFLTNPEVRAAYDKAIKAHAAGGGGAQPGAPSKGAVQDGYRFKGGDPSKAESWEKV